MDLNADSFPGSAAGFAAAECCAVMDNVLTVYTVDAVTAGDNEPAGTDYASFVFVHVAVVGLRSAVPYVSAENIVDGI